MNNHERLFKKQYQVNVDLYDDWFEVDLYKNDLEEILEDVFDESVWEFYNNLPEDKKLQKNSSHRFHTVVDYKSEEVDVTFDDICQLVDQLDEVDRISLLTDSDNIRKNSKVASIEIPNMAAEKEFEEWYEEFQKRWK